MKPHDAMATTEAQATAALAAHRQQRLHAFVRPYTETLAAQIDLRLVKTLLEVLATLLAWRQRSLGLVLSESGGALAGGAHAPALPKRISRLLHAKTWTAHLLTSLLWEQASARNHLGR
jgi:hypothetical protein